jgi:uncharacterized protein YuzE
MTEPVERRLRFTYDAESDACYIYVTDPIEWGGAKSSTSLHRHIPGASVVVDFDEDNRLLGIELLGVSRLLRPDAIPRADA